MVAPSRKATAPVTPPTATGGTAWTAAASKTAWPTASTGMTASAKVAVGCRTANAVAPALPASPSSPL